MKRDRRKPPSPALRRKYARNRIRRKVLQGQIDRLTGEIEVYMRALEGGPTPAKAKGLEKKVLDATDKRLALEKERDSLRTRRAPRGKTRRGKGSGKGII